MVSNALRSGSTGSRVRELQSLLSTKGFDVRTDGAYGRSTELAVRQFQKQHKMIADGVAGPKTLALLTSDGSSMVPMENKLQAQLVRTLGPVGSGLQSLAHVTPRSTAITVSKPISNLRISAEGVQFLYVHEAQKNHSNRLHWPGGDSGVTLGPGYDMGGRTASAIAADLIAIGVDAKVAKAVSAAEKKCGQFARIFFEANKNLINLTEKQERMLLGVVVPRYESILKNRITVPLLQWQYDALVSFAYNPGGRLKSVCDHLNIGNTSAAMAKIGEAVTSGGATLPGLVKRRRHEVALYTLGIYARSPTE